MNPMPRRVRQNRRGSLILKVTKPKRPVLGAGCVYGGLEGGCVYEHPPMKCLQAFAVNTTAEQPVYVAIANE
jgi:hypothetical protein